MSTGKKVLLSLAGLGLVLGLSATIAYQIPAVQDALFERAARMVLGQTPAPIDGLRVVVCGSGSPLGNVPSRAQTCVAVLTQEHFFLFDVGARSPLRIAQARLPVARLDGVLLTHFHSDHIASLPDVNLASWVQGRQDSLPVYGPAGVHKVVNGFNQAYDLDFGYRVAHHGTELLPPRAGPMTPVAITPGDVVWQDEHLTIASFLVDHAPIHPAVGYRVDYRGRSVVISGDTNAHDNLFAAARGADVLLHDALSRTLLDPMIAAATELNVPVMPTIMTDVIDYHADARTLETRAAEAGVRQLVLYHLVPVPANALAEKMFARDLADDTVLANDLLTFDMPPDSEEIRIREP